MFRSITNSTSKNLSAGGTLTGDVTITGDLTVQGGGSLAFDEIIEGSLNVKRASAGSITVPAVSDDLVIENSDNAGISILTPDDKMGTIGFGSPADAIAGMVRYDETNKTMIFGTVEGTNAGNIKLITANEVTAMTIDSSQHVGIGVIPDGISFRVEKEVNGNWAGLIGNTHATNGSGLKVQAGDDANVDSFRVSDVSNNTLFNINGAGQIGIAHSAPATTMHVVTTDGITVSDTATDNTNPTTADGTTDKHLTILRSAIRSHAPTNANANLTIGMKGGNTTGGNLKFQTGNTETDRIVIDREGTSDFQNNYIVNEQGRQNHVANTMSSPYYRFAGDDYIDTGQAFQTTLRNAFSISMMFCLDDAGGSTTYQCLMGARNSSEEDWIQIDIYQNTIRFVYVSDNDTVISTSASGLIPTGRTGWQHLVCTADGTNMITYLNGVNVKSTSMTSVTMSDYTSSDEIFIGGRDNNGSLQLPILNGDIQRFAVHNHALTATEVKELYSGASVPFKYKGANQTNLVTNGGFDSNTNDWDAQNGTLSSESGGQSGNCLKVLQTTGSSAYASQDITTVIGKRYRFSFYVKQGNNANGAHARVGTSQFGNEVSGDLSLTVTGSFVQHSIEFTATTTTSYIQVASGFTASTYQLFDTITCVPIGAVAEYDGSGVDSDRWMDKSGNDLHGTVSGATVENAPSGDDGLVYEEGEYTPALSCSSSGTFGLSSGSNTFVYTKIGRQVHVQGEIQVTSESGSPSGDLRLTLPFSTAVTQTTDSSDIAIGHLQLSSSGTTLAGQLYCRTQGGLNYMTFRMRNDDCSETVLDESSVDTDFYIGINLTYNAELDN